MYIELYIGFVLKKSEEILELIDSSTPYPGNSRCYLLDILHKRPSGSSGASSKDKNINSSLISFLID